MNCPGTISEVFRRESNPKVFWEGKFQTTLLTYSDKTGFYLVKLLCVHGMSTMFFTLLS